MSILNYIKLFLALALMALVMFLVQPTAWGQGQQIVAGTEQLWQEVVAPKLSTLEHENYLLNIQIMSLRIENENLKARLKAFEEHKEAK